MPNEEATRSPERTCAACNRAMPKDRMVRLTLSPEKRVELDYSGRLKGRGAYLFPNRACFDKARKKGGLARSFKEEKFDFDPERLFDVLVRENRTKVLGWIALAQKAHALISGANNVEAVLDQERVKLLILSEDASEPSRRAFEKSCEARGIPVRVMLESGELGRAIGKEERKVLAVTETAFAGHLLQHGAIYDAIQGRIVCPNLASKRETT